MARPASARHAQPVVLDASSAALDALRAALDGSGPAVLPVPPGGPAGDVVAAARLREPVDGGTALLVATSGSTDGTKVVELSGDALRASAAAAHARLGGPGSWLLALPAHHVAGAQVLVRSALALTVPQQLEPSAAAEPVQLAAAAARLADGPRYVSLVPTQVARLAGVPGGPDALRAFDAVLVGGAAADPAVVRRCRGAGVRVVLTYGMTETCGGCVYDGVPLDGVRVRARGADGRVELGGPVVARGYRGRPELTAAAFSTDADGVRWFTTDDLGAVGADGVLAVTGRADDVVVTGGLKVAPGPVESALRAHPAVRDACVVGLPDPEWGQVVAAALVAEPGRARPSLDELRHLVRGAVGAAAAPRAVGWVAAVPLRGPGKPDRRAVRELLLRPDADAARPG